MPALYIIGVGINLPAQVTVEAYVALESAVRVFSIVRVDRQPWLQEVCGARAVSLLDGYRAEVQRRINYEWAIDTIEASITNDGPVAYLTYGNPLFYDSVAQGLVRRCQARRVPYSVVPGISSVDAILCELGKSVAPGLQIYDATWLASSETAPRTSVDCVLVQIGAFGTDRAIDIIRNRGNVKVAPDQLRPLQAWLRRFYPATHPVTFVRARIAREDTGYCHTTQLAGIDHATEADLLNTCLWIPELTPTEGAVHPS